MAIFSRGFRGRPQSAETASKLPPGQYETKDFPVLSAGPTPRTPLASWTFTLQGANGQTARWTWDEFTALPRQTTTKDIHCVTKWSKFDTVWEGISVDTILSEAAAKGVVPSPFVLARCDGGYTTNLPLADVTGGKGLGRFHVQRRSAPAGARRTGAPARAASLLLEEREVGA